MRKEDRHQGQVKLHRNQGYSPLSPSKRSTCRSYARRDPPEPYAILGVPWKVVIDIRQPEGRKRHRRMRTRIRSRRSHTTIPQGIEGEQQAKEVLNLIGGEGESALVLREQILNICFGELEAGDWTQWEHLLGTSIGWKDFAAAIRMIQCRSEAEQHGVEMPQWYFVTGVLEQGGLLPYYPLTNEIPMEKQEETICAVSATVPACAKRQYSGTCLTTRARSSCRS